MIFLYAEVSSKFLNEHKLLNVNRKNILVVHDGFILCLASNIINVRKYIGRNYIPLFNSKWDRLKSEKVYYGFGKMSKA